MSENLTNPDDNLGVGDTASGNTSAINRKKPIEPNTADATLSNTATNWSNVKPAPQNAVVSGCGQAALTHSPDCWRHHPKCAVKRLERVLEYLNEPEQADLSPEFEIWLSPIRAIIAGEE